ncbi:MAG: TIGR00725 family protein, partial [Candidatus Celaenobacter polaris]|nr:TIGR00725 family protein [Candidatus Celaenobacter polaris]
ARTCDLAIAIDGKYGTLSEIAYCLDFGKTVLGYKTHNIDKVIQIKKPEDIIKYL